MKTFVPCVKITVLFVLLSLGSSHVVTGQIIDFGKSYINVSKGVNGGTVETGDTLEIRASFVVRSGTYDSCGYFDNIPVGTTYILGTVRVLTNEGKIYKQFTDAINDDEGWRSGSQIRINLGYRQTDGQASAVRRGRVRNNNGHKPSFYGSATIQVASFRVRVTAAIGTNISLGGGYFTYRLGTNPIQTFTFPSNTVAVYRNFGICSNSIGVNSLGTEFNGTFGSGQARNRVASANVPVGYGYQIFNTNTPNDYTYGIPNNTSTRQNYTTSNAWAKPDNSTPTHRVFNVWDIIGDHTGAASPILGNPAADTVANPNAGYMLVVNAAYRIDSAFQHTISNLCPNTYYEISCWMRNICSKCGCDSNGTGATGGAGYIPTATGDSSGVYPNLTFEVDGIDYYSTGNLRYSGQWVKKGFTFLTGPTQTSFTLKLFNNAPGGGGNDWALDDITVATCTPNLQLNPSADPTVCQDNLVTMSCTVRSFFNNYTYYKWQRSTDGGVIWNDTGVGGGPAVPIWNGSAWEYTATYPPYVGTTADSGHRYRLVVATTASNLSSSSCGFSETTVITVHIIDCGDPLQTDILSFSGKVEDGYGVLNWSTTEENELITFTIEKSADGINFLPIGTVEGTDQSGGINVYSFTDPKLLIGVQYYRMKMTANGKLKYSRTVQLSAASKGLTFLSVINPFNHALSFDFTSDAAGSAEVALIDGSGEIIRKLKTNVQVGQNSFSINDTDNLPAGIYTLRVHTGNESIYKRVLKQ